jgi:hypothetical protein
VGAATALAPWAIAWVIGAEVLGFMRSSFIVIDWFNLEGGTACTSMDINASKWIGCTKIVQGYPP